MINNVGKQSRILQQGQMDGFCLLYAVLNAFKAVKYPEQGAADFADEVSNVWSQMISATPSLQSFSCNGSFLPEISADGEPTKLDIAAKELLLKQYGEILSEYLDDGGRVKIERVTKYDKMGSWHSSLLSGTWENSALILCLAARQPLLETLFENEHWVAVVGNQKEQLCVACSITGHLPDGIERERQVQIEKEQRPYNQLTTKKLSPSNICADYRFRLSVS